jgi:hypothetical protein
MCGFSSGPLPRGLERRTFVEHQQGGGEEEAIAIELMDREQGLQQQRVALQSIHTITSDQYSHATHSQACHGRTGAGARRCMIEILKRRR